MYIKQSNILVFEPLNEIIETTILSEVGKISVFPVNDNLNNSTISLMDEVYQFEKSKANKSDQNNNDEKPNNDKKRKNEIDKVHDKIHKTVKKITKKISKKVSENLNKEKEMKNANETKKADIIKTKISSAVEKVINKEEKKKFEESNGHMSAELLSINSAKNLLEKENLDNIIDVLKKFYK